jgi:mannose-6-phosphate isomerase-like protein (cupin superfamily)
MPMLTHNKIQTISKPWGKEEIIEKKPGEWIKKLYVDEGKRFSYQSHQNRVENWLVLFGEIEVIKDNQTYQLKEGDYLKVNQGEKHRIIGVKPSCILEVAFGQVSDTDIIRYQDDYGRK